MSAAAPLGDAEPLPGGAGEASADAERAVDGRRTPRVAGGGSSLPATPGKRLALLLLIVLVGLGLRACNLGADIPLGLSPSNSELMDGPWYLAEAVDGARGREADVPDHYRKPIFNWLGRSAFAIGGVSLETAHAMQAVLGALMVLFAGAAGWVAFGYRAGLLAALLLAVGFVPVGYGRAVLVYGPLATGLAAAGFFLLAGFRWRLLLLPAWLIVGGLAAGLQIHAVLVVPAFALGTVLALFPSRPLRAVLLLPVVLAAGAGLTWAVAPAFVETALGRASSYMGDPTALELLRRILSAPYMSGVITKAPVLFALGWIGVLLAFGRRRDPERDAPSAVRVEWVLAGWVLTWLLVMGSFQFASGELHLAPLRQFMPALVPVALLAGRLLDRMLERRPLLEGVPAPWVALWSALSAIWLVGLLAAQAFFFYFYLHPGREELPAHLGWFGTLTGVLLIALPLAAAATLLVVRKQQMGSAGGVSGAAVDRTGAADAVGGRPHRRRLTARHLVPRIVILALVLDVLHAWPMVAAPSRDLRGANAFSAQLLGDDARLAGTWAHALTYGAPQVTRHFRLGGLERLVAEDRDVTHVVVPVHARDRFVSAMEAEGYPRFSPLVQIMLRGDRVLLYRLPWAEPLGYQPTAMERELEAISAQGELPTLSPSR